MKEPTEEARDAVEQMSMMYQQALFGFFRRLSVPALDAEDLAQDTFIHALKYFGTYDAEKGAVRPWLFSIARNRANKYHSQKHRGSVVMSAASSFDLEEGIDPADVFFHDEREPSSLDNVVRREEESDARRLLVLVDDARCRLPREFQDDLQVLLDEPSYSAVARSRGTTVGVLKMRTYRARQELYTILRIGEVSFPEHLQHLAQ